MKDDHRIPVNLTVSLEALACLQRCQGRPVRGVVVAYVTQDGEAACDMAVPPGEDLARYIGAVEAAKLHLWDAATKFDPESEDGGEDGDGGLCGDGCGGMSWGN